MNTELKQNGTIGKCIAANRFAEHRTTRKTVIDINFNFTNNIREKENDEYIY